MRKTTLRITKIDGRKLSQEQSEYIRMQAVKSVRIDKASPEGVIKVFGLHRSCIYRWLNKYDIGGLDALKSVKALGPKTNKNLYSDLLSKTLLK